MLEDTMYVRGHNVCQRTQCMLEDTMDVRGHNVC